jgi:hypothetical protein
MPQSSVAVQFSSVFFFSDLLFPRFDPISLLAEESEFGRSQKNPSERKKTIQFIVNG